MKNYRGHLLLLIIIIASYLANTIMTNQDRQPDLVLEYVTDIPIYEVAAIAIRNEKDSYGLIPGEKQIMVEPQNNFHYTQKELQSTLFLLSHITAHDRLSDAESKSALRLDEPAANFSLFTRSGDVLRFILSKVRAPNGHAYIYSEDAAEAFLIAPEVSNRLLLGRVDYVEKKMFALPEMTSDAHGQISVEHHEENSLSFQIIWKKGLNFQVTQPINGIPATVLVAQHFILPLASVRANEAFEGIEQLQGKTLGSPVATIKIDFEDQHEEATIYRDLTNYYFLRNSEELVFRVHEEQFGFLWKGASALLNGSIVSVAQGDVQFVEMEYEEHIARISADELEKLGLGQLFNIPIVRQTDEHIPKGQPMVLSYEKNNGSKFDIMIHQPLEDGCPVSINNKVSFLTETGLYDRLLRILTAKVSNTDHALDGVRAPDGIKE